MPDFYGRAPEGTTYTITEEAKNNIEAKKAADDGTSESSKLRLFECPDFLTGMEIWVHKDKIKPITLNDITEGAVCAKGKEPIPVEEKEPEIVPAKENTEVAPAAEPKTTPEKKPPILKLTPITRQEISSEGKQKIYFKEPYAGMPQKRTTDTNRILKKTEVKRIRINENEYSYYVNSSFTNKNNESELYEGFFKEFADEFPPYNWNKFGFGKRSATDEKTTCWFWKSEDAGKYIFDYDTTKSELIKQIVERIDTGVKDGVLDEKEIDLALGNSRIKYELSRFICYHRSEWSYSDTSTLEEEVKTFYERYIDKEIKGNEHNPRVVEYHATTSYKAKDDDIGNFTSTR
jgi:hypothetical protein